MRSKQRLSNTSVISQLKELNGSMQFLTEPEQVLVWLNALKERDLKKVSSICAGLAEKANILVLSARLRLEKINLRKNSENTPRGASRKDFTLV